MAKFKQKAKTRKIAPYTLVNIYEVLDEKAHEKYGTSFSELTQKEKSAIAEKEFKEI